MKRPTKVIFLFCISFACLASHGMAAPPQKCGEEYLKAQWLGKGQKQKKDLATLSDSLSNVLTKFNQNSTNYDASQFPQREVFKRGIEKMQVDLDTLIKDTIYSIDSNRNCNVCKYKARYDKVHKIYDVCQDLIKEAAKLHPDVYGKASDRRDSFFCDFLEKGGLSRADLDKSQYDDSFWEEVQRRQASLAYALRNTPSATDVNKATERLGQEFLSKFSHEDDAQGNLEADVGTINNNTITCKS